MDLVYDSGHQVVVCKRCQTCIGPSRTSIEQHLRKKPHRLTGQTLKSYLEYTDSLALQPLEYLRDQKPKTINAPSHYGIVRHKCPCTYPRPP